MVTRSQSTLCTHRAAQHCALNNTIGVFSTVCTPRGPTNACVPLSVSSPLCYYNERHYGVLILKGSSFTSQVRRLPMEPGFILSKLKKNARESWILHLGYFVLSRKGAGCVQAVIGTSLSG